MGHPGAVHPEASDRVARVDVDALKRSLTAWRRQLTEAASLLGAARRTKNDEFYTQWADIEREMNAYLEYDRDVFRDKVLLLPCDDPEWSNFTKFFALHFLDFGLKKLISTSFAPDSNPAGQFYAPTLFETADPQFDATKTRLNGKKFTLERKDLNTDGVINIDDLQWEYLEGTGDFRSEEVTALRDEADFVITNPPFSLFRQFMTWLQEGRNRFAVIGNQNALTYQEVFPLIRENKVWLGKGFPRNMAHFNTPYVTHSKWVEQEGEGVVRVAGVQWFTNIDHGRRHEPLQLMSMADNIKFSKHKDVRGVGYKPYDNFNAIDVPHTDAIPGDFDGMMGVPITFLNKYNPEQFEIIGSLNNGAHGNELGATKTETEMTDGKVIMWNGPVVERQPRYKRIIIKRKPTA
ncbi:adenine-specific methyltransferase EcoRI family protein [Microbacterium oxydans]|uniref:adenine-specific methyltransferase EcoRI family protein n=1 Tax=Microbacterium oxydans TaxID=82380 RepID=UPI0022B1029D|nr:adenine-specific methyltransferase EcoRI family protein [Microbacterium oxydans]MCZ4302191.1 DNA methyltransferase [Microbacterium oxydans]